MEEQMKVKFVKMPISKAEKRKFNRAGYRVVDIRFKPVDVVDDEDEGEDDADKAAKAAARKAKREAEKAAKAAEGAPGEGDE